MQNIYFHLPGLFEFFDFYQVLLYVYKEERDKFNDWANIGSIYGAPREALWNGGRFNNFISPNEDIIALIMKENNIPCRFTFSNSLIEEKHLNDTLCNLLLDKFNWDGHNNQIIVNSKILEDYLRDNYPQYELISSVTKCITDENEILKEINQDYIMVVLDYNHNKDMDFLKSIKDKDRIEMIVNPVCNPKCPKLREHYKAIDKTLLHQPSDWFYNCPNQTQLFFERQKNPTFISVDEIKDIYSPMGFKNFKIEGRNTSLANLIEIIVYYMIKPEYQLEIRQKLTHSYM